MVKKIFMSITFLLFALTMVAQELFVGTYNVRNKNESDAKAGNGWERRCQSLCGIINFEQPDIFGTQEVLHTQLTDMLDQLDGYDYIGVGRDDGKQGGEYAAIFYKKANVKLLDHGDFWLSEDTSRPNLGWDAACIRICTWGQFLDQKTNLKFYFFNLHMDHVGIVARRESAKLVVRKIKKIAKGAPVVLTGDFNVDQHNEIYETFVSSGVLNDSYAVAKQRLADNGTFNSYNPDVVTDSRIDHVFVSPDFLVNHYAIMTNVYWTEKVVSEGSRKGNDAPKEIDLRPADRRLPSDHYPVFAKLALKP